MKKLLLAAFVGVLGTVQAFAQDTITDPYHPSKNPVVASINAKYQINKAQAAELTDEKVFPLIGSYDVMVKDSMQTFPVTVALDPANKGIVWVEGMPQGKFKAYLKKSPAVYKIPAQKSESGKTVPEGTIWYDVDANALQVQFGKQFNDADPAAAFAVVTEAEATPVTKSKSKSKKAVKAKVWNYTGQKNIAVTTASSASVQGMD